MLYFIILYI